MEIGYPPPPERTWDHWKYYGMEIGYPPRCGQTNKLKILSSLILRIRAIITRSRNPLLDLSDLLFAKNQNHANSYNNKIHWLQKLNLSTLQGDLSILNGS